MATYIVFNSTSIAKTTLDLKLLKKPKIAALLEEDRDIILTLLKVYRLLTL